MRNEMLRWSFTLKIGVLEPYTDLTAQRHREQNPGGVHEDYRATQPRDGLKNGKFGLRPVQRSGQGHGGKANDALTFKLDQSLRGRSGLRKMSIHVSVSCVGASIKGPKRWKMRAKRKLIS